ncbi:hypothetical protein Agub_g4729 [Astrephomene gubernaculifera]|uniref:Uncharacterized protein n=1 Tax=Astrephomene gubernaculifera TaxID=47775 RepID=A0AAD3DKQ3_9CHLO|nr:hypothetical protein Agub_g4729 [Astrephomene gubernaculifera]
MAFAQQARCPAQPNGVSRSQPLSMHFTSTASFRSALSVPGGAMRPSKARLLGVSASGNIVEGHVTSSPPAPSGSANVANSGPPSPLVEGQLATAVTPSALGSLDDMAAFVERTRQEEENIRRRREEVELQLLRMRQQEAVRQQQALKLKMASERANAAVVLREQTGAAAPAAAAAAAAAAPAAAGPTQQQEGEDGHAGAAAASASGGPGSLPAGGPPRKKLMLKKSKRMSAIAAASGLHRVTPPLGSSSSSPASPAPRGSSAAPSSSGAGGGLLQAGGSSGGGGGGGKALLCREELIEKSKEGAGAGAALGGGGSDCECSVDFEEVVVPKPIFVISDCTGESAARTVRAALNQFELRCRTSAPAQIMIFRFVESIEKVMSIIQEAAKEDALVVYTLVDPKAVKAVQTACTLQQVRYVDLWTTLLDTMEVHLNAARSGVPSSLAETRRKPKASLNDEYFRMIEAVEYTRKMDDGAHPQEWASADLVVLGVSRCGKTPLSIYLGQRGYKVANLPLIPGCPVPRELFEIDQTRIVGLIIDPHVLATIRRNRVNMMGVARAQAIDYAEVQKINAELDWARKLYNAHPEWPVLDVTLRGIEETAARILKLLNDRRGDASPKWVEAYHAKMAASSAAQAPAVGGAAEAGAGSYGIPEMIYGANESTFLMQGLY